MPRGAVRSRRERCRPAAEASVSPRRRLQGETERGTEARWFRETRPSRQTNLHICLVPKGRAQAGHQLNQGERLAKRKRPVGVGFSDRPQPA